MEIVNSIVLEVLKMGLPPIKRGFGYVKRQFGYVMSSERYADNLGKEVQNLDRELQRVPSAEEMARNNHPDERVPVLLATAEQASEDAKTLLRRFEEASKACCRGTIPDPKCLYQFSRKAERKTDDIQKLIVPVRYAADLRKEVENLENEFERVGDLEKGAKNNIRNLLGVFRTWKANAEEALKVARDLLGDLEGSLPREQLSTNAEAQIKVVRELTQESIRFRVMDDISSNDPASGRREGKDIMQPTAPTASVYTASPSIKLESRALMIQDIMDALADNSKSVVGVYGMGGIGKSTLLDQVKSILSRERSFDWIAKADVSQNPDIKRIQGEIAHWLGLTGINKEENVSLRAELLHRRLEYEEREKKKVLIILDNLWDGVDLKSVGIPCGHDNKVKGCKLLLTSRHLNVLQGDMGCDKAFRLEGLEEEEARALFETIVGDKVQKVEFKPWVEKALRRCAGVPFLLVALAKRFKNAELFQWKDALRKMEQFNDKNINESIDHVLRWSYDNLEEEATALLRLCVVCSVSKPSLEDLVRYGFGLGLFGEVSSMEEARDRLHTLIRALQDYALLLDSKDVGDFKTHDLVRDFVASVSWRDHHPLLMLKDKDMPITASRKDELKSCEAMCLPDMKELPQELCCPELRIFLLFSNNESTEVPDSYFNSMRKLAVLNLTSIRFTRSLMLFQFSENLHTLCLQRCSLEDVAILGKLKGLQILSIVNSDIQQLPKEIGQLVELRSLDLSRCYSLKIIEPGVLGSLTRLEELYMENSFDQWNSREQTPPTNASLIELNNMENLRTLRVSIPYPSVLPEDLHVEQLTKYNIRIGYTRWWHCSVSSGSKTLHLLNPTSDFLRKECIQSILRKTDELFLDMFNGSEQSIYGLSLEGFPHLKRLDVDDSPSICYILERSSLPTNALETLLLYKLVNLEKIINNNISTKSFSTLKEIRVEQCSKMEVLFPRSVVRELPQLEEIKVDDCKLMRGIVEADDDRGKLEFPKLRVLKLCGLPNIENFIIAGSAPSSSNSDGQVGTQIAFFSEQQVSFPTLESLYISKLPNLKEIWSDESPSELSNLRSLEVMHCNSLSKIISSKSLVQLPKLQTLCVNYCSSVEEIFEFEGSSASGIVETLSELTTLELSKLGSLRRIWNKNPSGIMRLHNLKEFKLDNCDNLEFIFFPSMVKSLAQLRDLKVSNCKAMETIIAEEGVGMEISETLAFPILTNLTLTHLESLTSFSRGKSMTGSREARRKDHVSSLSIARFSGEVAIPRLETLKIDRLDNLRFMFSPSMVRSLTQLRELSVSNCKKMEAIIMEEEGSGVEISEILAFPMLTHLRLKNLESLGKKCSRESQSQDDVPSHSGALFNRKVAFPRLEKLKIDSLDNIRFIFSPSTVRSLAQLRKISVKFCEKMEAIVMEDEGSGVEILGTLAFSMLTDLRLTRLKSLTCFSREKCSREGQGQDHVQLHLLFNQKVAFPRLETLEIFCLDNLEFMFSPSTVRSFAKLRKLSVLSCYKMEAIVMEDEGSRVGISETLAFSMLTDLCLTWLKSLMCFFRTKCSREGPGQDHIQLHSSALFNQKVALPSLETLYLIGMDNIEMIWGNQVAVDSFPRLKSLFVVRCDKLMTVVPCFVLGQLLCLESLEAKACGSLEVVFGLQPLIPLDGHPIALQLKELAISELPKLKRVWDKELHRQVKFQRLRSVSVSECNSLTSLFPASVTTDLIQLEELVIRECGIVELIEKEEGLLVTRFVFPKLTSLELNHLTELKCLYTGTHSSHWPALKTLEMDYCNKVDILASSTDNEIPCHKQPLFLLEKGAFPSLQELKLDLSGRVEIWHGNFHDEESFCKPRVLKLHHLSKEYAMSTCQFVESLTNLEELVVSESYLEEPINNVEAIDGPCQELKVIFPFSRCIQHLKTLDVSCFHGLSSLFTPTIAENLVALTKLRISNCRILTEVISDEEFEEKCAVAFNQLKYIELEGLMQLRCFSSSRCTLVFPLLEDVIVNGCPNMGVFSNGPINTPKLGTVKVASRERYRPTEYRYFWKGNLNITIQNMYEETP